MTRCRLRSDGVVASPQISKVRLDGESLALVMGCLSEGFRRDCVGEGLRAGGVCLVAVICGFRGDCVGEGLRAGGICPVTVICGWLIGSCRGFQPERS